MMCNRQTPATGNARGACGVHAEMTRVIVYNLPIGRLNPEQDNQQAATRSETGLVIPGAKLV